MEHVPLSTVHAEHWSVPDKNKQQGLCSIGGSKVTRSIIACALNASSMVEYIFMGYVIHLMDHYWYLFNMCPLQPRVHVTAKEHICDSSVIACEWQTGMYVGVYRQPDLSHVDL